MDWERELSRPMIHRYRDTAAAGLSLLEARFELFGLEFRQERLRAVEVLLLAGVGFCFLLLALIALTLALAFFLPPSARLTAMLIVAGVYAAAALAAFLGIRFKLNRRPEPFAETLAEIKEDLKCF
jgi:uncharacterized membrane protein YqjE